MDGLRGNVAADEVAGNLIDALFGFAEYNDLIHMQINNQTFEQVAFFERINGNDVLLDIGVGGVLRSHFNHFGRVHKILRKLADRR